MTLIIAIQLFPLFQPLSTINRTENHLSTQAFNWWLVTASRATQDFHRLLIYFFVAIVSDTMTNQRWQNMAYMVEVIIFHANNFSIVGRILHSTSYLPLVHGRGRKKWELCPICLHMAYYGNQLLHVYISLCSLCMVPQWRWNWWIKPTNFKSWLLMSIMLLLMACLYLA